LTFIYRCRCCELVKVLTQFKSKQSMKKHLKKHKKAELILALNEWGVYTDE